MGEKTQHDEAVCCMCTGQGGGHSENGKAPTDYRNKEKFSGEGRKDFFDFFCFVFICSVVAKNVLLLMTTENMRKPKQGVGNLQGLFGTTESNRPEQTSKGPKSWARTCRHSTSNVQIFNSWWYTKRTDTGHGKWCRVLEVLVVPDID